MLHGSTELVAIVGSPITQVKSPENFNRWFQANRHDLAMLPIDIREDALDAFIATLRGWQNLRGVVVTVPYKQALAGRLDEVSERAAALGSVNVIRRQADGRLLGDNVDGEGFLNAACLNGFRAEGKRALVIGAGGVGSAIAWSLCQAGVASLVLSDASAARCQALAELLGKAFARVRIAIGYDSLQGFDLVVNATPAGMGGTGELPLDAAQLDSLDSATLVADVVTSPEITPLLAAARERGCAIQTGPQMVFAQLGNLGHFMGVTPLQL
ncbi:shikimate dehydrogenase [Pseudomonas sp. 148P]|uniref:shikimate dehydrogenase (NADP(+)) n=1 Tax=Pseudomonas ulcerans TaxID=3115852 RepID=A0ABU7HW99_9PSED|nr:MULTISPECIES: shikimate dehydrogenase [unclassified Pseudomonas]MEE1924685.1 shikimate dehydrogenase [Pseudomonas sp. 147P]MEE1935801.1 shikimate dehydrogenase [Pseudomonas sp. 148P]